MNYDVLFSDGFAEDLCSLAAYETQFTLSHDLSFEHLEAVVDEIIKALKIFPERYPEKPYGFTDTMRRKYTIGKYAAFYWVDNESATVWVERLAHSKSDFSRIHFGN